MLDLRLVWDDASPVVLLCHSGRKFVLFQANVGHHLPLITHPELKILLLALNAVTTTGEIWNYHRWLEHLGYQLEEYLWPSAPPSTAYSHSTQPLRHASSTLRREHGSCPLCFAQRRHTPEGAG